MRSTPVITCLVAVGLSLASSACSGDAAATSPSKGPTTSTVVAEPAGHGDDSPEVPAVPPARLDVVATDYEWSGLPEVLPAGTYPMSFVNRGDEVHEISIFRNPDRIDLDELYRLGPAGMNDVVDPVGVLIAVHGEAAAEELTVTLTPGTYEVVCFVPAANLDGRPHFAHGMHRTLTVR